MGRLLENDQAGLARIAPLPVDGPSGLAMAATAEAADPPNSGVAAIRSLRTWLWRGTLAAGAIAFLFCYASGFGLTPGSVPLVAGYAVAALICCLVHPASCGKHARLASLIDSFLLFTMIGALGAILSYMAMVHSTGFTDDLLAGIDESLGFDWRAIHDAVGRRPLLWLILDRAYFSCFAMPFVLLGLLYLWGHTEHLYRYLLAHGLALAVTVGIFFFLPARAAFAHYLGSEPDLPGNVIHYTAIISGLRDGSLATLDLTDLGGIITFPSFHASMAILFVWGTWPCRPFRVPIAAVNILMWLASVPIGGHYVIDLLGGSVVALAAIAVAKRVGRPGRSAGRSGAGAGRDEAWNAPAISSGASC